MTGTEDLHYRGLAGIAADIAAGAITAQEVTAHILDRISALEPRLRAFTEIRDEAARDEARAADARRSRGEPLGPLHGVPIAVKDMCAVAGTNTRAGGAFPTGFGPKEDATVVARLRAAGAIVIGKTRMTEGAWANYHPDVAAPVNPWGADIWAGVSSSGSAVSVAAGMAFGAIGTDTAGSIRFPSACNHLVGLKPSWGRISRHGVFPLAATLDHVGPMARTVLDAALMFAAIAGPDPLDPTALAGPVADWVGAARSGTLRDVRIGVDPDYCFEGIDEPTVTALRRAIARMEEAGAVIVPVALPGVAHILEGAIAAALVEAAVSHAATYPSQRECYSDPFAALLEVGIATPSVDYARIALWRREFRGRLRQMFSEVDMIAAPVAPIAPPPIAFMEAAAKGPPLSTAPLTAFTIPFNLAGVPCLTLPMGDVPSGRPLGFQLIGPDLAEAALLSAGAGYEAVAGYARQNPAM